MKKRTYRGVEVKKVNRASLAEAVAGKDLVVGVDVGKEVCFGSLVGGDRGSGYGEMEQSLGESIFCRAAAWVGLQDHCSGYGAERDLWGSTPQSAVGSRDSSLSSQCEAEPRCGGGI